MSAEKVNYFNQPNCYKITNGTVEVIVTTDIGPRVIAYRFIGRENILAEMGPEDVVKTELGEWHPWGGHRLWHAPEDMPRTYEPDNNPIKFEIVGENGIRLMRGVEEHTNIEKEMLVQLDPNSTRVTVTMTLTNRGLWPVELAPWGLTIMNGGGTTIFPNEPYINHNDAMLPARPLVLWHYTNMADPRWSFGTKYVTLSTDSNDSESQKIGAANKQGWAGYLRKNTFFIKSFPYIEGADYPDMGSNFETYTAGDFMEIETLGSTVKLAKGESVTHIENWHLFDGVNADKSEASIDSVLLPLVEKAK